MTTWGTIYNRHLATGEDHGAAAFAADEWEKRKKKKACEWRQDDDGSWDTDCENKFCIEEGTPEENGMRFCCYCGKKLMMPNAIAQGREHSERPSGTEGSTT